MSCRIKQVHRGVRALGAAERSPRRYTDRCSAAAEAGQKRSRNAGRSLAAAAACSGGERAAIAHKQQTADLRTRHATQCAESGSDKLLPLCSQVL